jgi:tripartite-type tricarboxylate transporter receptor subunit TctC
MRHLPDVPTLEEAGVSGVDVTQWYGLFAPAGTPGAIVARLNDALNTVLREPAVVQRIEAHGATVRTDSPAELRALVGDELAKWRGVVRQARLSPN